MCYILCMSSSVCVALGAHRGAKSPHARVQGQRPENFFCLDFHVTYLGGFSAHGFLPMVFYFWLRN
jgi:hypothetical protein